MTAPIKRNETLQIVSREHHFALLLCWKIREGLKKNIDTKRIQDYIDWFWENNLIRHFEIEEATLFTILPIENELYKKAMEEHESLKKLFSEKNKTKDILEKIANELDAHVRFEERTLFNVLQLQATKEQLQQIEQHHNYKILDDWKDEFWENKN